jgi:hypothetical protein
MIRLIGRPASRVLGLLAAVAWVLSALAGQIHGLRTVHAVCLQHGELIDVPARQADAHADGDRSGPTAWLGAPDDDHGCRIEVLVPLEPLPVVFVRAAHRLSFPLVDPLAAHEAPRGPPLAYAPKTSPPALV